MYKTQIGSDAHGHIFDLLELDKMCKNVGMERNDKEDPKHVREVSPLLQESSMDMMMHIEDKIRGWLIDTIAQERGEHDAAAIDRFNNNVLSQRGILQEAVDKARDKYTYEHQEEYLIYKSQ